MPKKPPARRKDSKPAIPPGAVIYAKASSIVVDGTRRVNLHGPSGPYTSFIAKKGNTEVVLPSATFVGFSPNDEYVAWDGEEYVLRPTMESINETDDLIFIARVDDPKDWSPLHQQVAAYKKIKEILEGPHEVIPEALVRRTLAQQYGCKPEEVTWKQIQFEVSGLLRYYPAISVVPAPDQENVESSTAPDTKGLELERRAKLLEEYKVATNTPSNRQIYEAKNSGIYKPEFYKWRNGTLRADSATTINFERFLQAKKPPIRW